MYRTGLHENGLRAMQEDSEGNPKVRSVAQACRVMRCVTHDSTYERKCCCSFGAVSTYSDFPNNLHVDD